MFGLHQEAMAYFDNKANALIAELKPLPVTKNTQNRRGSLSHRPVTKLPNEAIIGDSTYFNRFGRLVGFEIRKANIKEFLPEESADEIEAIASKVARQRGLQKYCSPIYVRNHLVGWIRRRRLNEPSVDSWTTDLLASLTRDVCDQTILTPLEGIHIETPFRLGHVTVNYFTESLINGLLQNVSKGDKDSEIFQEQFRKRYQGRVYTTFQYKSEKNYAQQLAFFHTDRALEVLKFLNPAALEIREQCFIGRMGQVSPAQWYAFQMQPNGKIFLSEGAEIYHGRPHYFSIDRKFLQTFQHEITIINKLLSKLNLSNLEKGCIEAISHFSHGVASFSPQDRLLHALVAIESLLLKSPNEPVQSNLGRRIALLATKKVQDRRNAVRDFQKGYDLRSRFVHHGTKLVDEDAANRALFLCWSAMLTVIEFTNKFDTKKGLLDYLENELLTTN
jgi:hypothetical protein